MTDATTTTRHTVDEFDPVLLGLGAVPAPARLPRAESTPTGSTRAIVASSIALSMTVPVILSQPAAASAAPIATSPINPVVVTERPTAALPEEVEVVEGDTVSRIAARHGLDTDDVLAWNGLHWSSLIFPGQRLALRAPSAERSAAVETAGQRTRTAASGVTKVSKRNRAEQIDVPRLSEAQRRNARIIIEEGRRADVGDRGIVVALATAAQESGLRNLDHGDRDSQGLFQQRPSAGWGTADQVRDKRRAARAFFGGEGNPNPGRTVGLLDIEGWRSMSITEAAQAVQRSAHPDAYAKWEQEARRWLHYLG